MSKENKRSMIRLNASESEQACREITATLPEWFGIPEANERYAVGVKKRLSFGYLIDENCLGMLCLEFPFVQTANIYWMGVKRESHHQGIGKALLRHAEQFCLEQRLYSLTVETLSPKQEDPSYLNTFKFYMSAGFQPLFELQPYGPDHLMIYLNKILSPKIFQWIDLTHELSETIPTWNGNCGFQHTTILKYEECSLDCQFLVQRIEMLAGSGTHIDAPAHCFPHGNTVNEIPLHSLISPCVVIDVSEEAHELYSIDMPVIEKFEKEQGKICSGTFVIFYTGWERFWDQPEKYHNHHRFPCVTKQVADYLLTQDVVGIGIDTLSPDRGDKGFPVHQVILGANKYIVENIAHASQMPATGGYAFVMPIHTAQGTEAPICLLGMISGHATTTNGLEF